MATCASSGRAEEAFFSGRGTVLACGQTPVFLRTRVIVHYVE